MNHPYAYPARSNNDLDQYAQQQQHSPTPAIRPIPVDAVRRIVAGQVIFDLASAAKELVDNALDAGSTTINGECK